MKKLKILVFIFMVSTGLMLSQVVHVTSPAAGIPWYKGTTQTIMWTSPNCQSGNIIINIFKNPVSAANFVLQLTGLNTGSKDWTIPNNFEDGQYVIRVKTDPAEDGCLGDSGVFTIASSTQPVTLQPMQVEAHFIKTPDLKISIIPVTGPTTEIYKKTLMQFKVDNIGNGASKETTMRVFMGSSVTDTWVIKPIEPGRFRYKTKEVTPEGVGYYLWSADVDHDNKIGDSNRANNYAKYKMIVKGSDLIVALWKGYRPELATKHKMIAWVKNVGSIKSLPSKLRFYLEKKGGETFDIPALNVDEVFEVSREVKWFTLGTKTITLRIDYNNNVPEENEKNNLIETSLKVKTFFGDTSLHNSYICSNGKTGSTKESVW